MEVVDIRDRSEEDWSSEIKHSSCFQGSISILGFFFSPCRSETSNFLCSQRLETCIFLCRKCEFFLSSALRPLLPFSVSYLNPASVLFIIHKVQLPVCFISCSYCTCSLVILCYSDSCKYYEKSPCFAKHLHLMWNCISYR